MRSRLGAIVLLAVWIWQMTSPAPGKPAEPSEPMCMVWMLVEDLGALVVYQVRLLPRWPPPRLCPRRLPRRRRHRPPQAAEEEEEEQPPKGWPDSIHTLLDPAACVTLFEQVRWAAGVVCPRCGSRDVQPLDRCTEAGLQYHRCLTCQAAGHPDLFHSWCW